MLCLSDRESMPVYEFIDERVYVLRLQRVFLLRFFRWQVRRRPPVTGGAFDNNEFLLLRSAFCSRIRAVLAAVSACCRSSSDIRRPLAQVRIAGPPLNKRPTPATEPIIIPIGGPILLE
jgi:hypothetical protein